MYVSTGSFLYAQRRSRAAVSACIGIIIAVACMPVLLDAFVPTIHIAGHEQYHRPILNGRVRLVLLDARHTRTNSVLNSVSSSQSVLEINNKLGLDDYFGRWRFLQTMLDDSDISTESAQIINSMVYWAIDGYLKYPRPKYEDTSLTGSLELTTERKERLERLVTDHAKDKRFNLYVVNDDIVNVDKNMLETLDKALPDPYEDEEEHNGAWDVVKELFGQEAVKIEERKGPSNTNWKARNVSARILIAYDFLTLGLLDGPVKS